MQNRLSKSSKNDAPSKKSTVYISSGRASPMDARAFPREASAVKLATCVHTAHGLLGVCDRTGGCGLGGVGEPRERARRLITSANSKRAFSAVSRHCSRSEMLRQKPANDVISQAGRPLPVSDVRVRVLSAGKRGGGLERRRAREDTRSRWGRA